MKLFTRFILWTSVQRPYLVLAIIAPLTILAALGVFRINFEDGLRTMFTSDSEVFQDYAAYSQNFSQSETDIAVLVSGSKPLTAPDFDHIEDFILDALFIDGIGGVLSNFSSQQFTSAKANLRPFLSKDGQETVLVFSLGGPMSNLSGPTGTLRNLRGLAEKSSNGSGLSFRITGLIPVREEIISGLKSDQMKINILGAFFGFLVSLAMFRSFWVALVNTITPVIALIFCLGSFGWLGLSINALTNALPVLILVLASSDSIHLTFEIRRRMGRGEELVAAVKGAMADIAPPCVLTSLTTFLAFASLFYSDSPIIKDLALAGVSGVFLAMLVVLFVHPMVFILAGRLPFVERALALKETAKPVSGANVFVKNFRLISVGGIGLLVGGIAILFPLQPSYRFMENIDTRNGVFQTLERVEKIVGPFGSIELMLHLNEDHTPTSPEVLADLANIHNAISGIAGIHSINSIHSLNQLLDQEQSAGNPQKLAELVQSLPEHMRRKLIGEKAEVILLSMQVPDNGSQFIAALAITITNVLAELELRTVTIGNPTGFLLMSSSVTDSMIGQLTISFLIASLACPILIGVWFWRFDFGVAAIIPNILPIVFAGAFLTAIDLDIQITAALALTIAFGIALDDSIHVFNRLSLEMRQSGQGASANLVGRAMAQVKPVLIVTTLILSAGLLATIVSEMPMIRFFGILCIGTFVLALLSDLILLPALIMWFASRSEAR